MKNFAGMAAIVCLCTWYACYQAKAATGSTADTTGMAPSLMYINGKAFIKAGLNGKDVKVGIVDVGFFDADKSPSLRHFFVNKRIVATKDFVHPSENVLFGRTTDMDWHGTAVWKFIGGRDTANYNYGLATDALFYLARTDDGVKEFRQEQEYFKAALEWLHNCGVRLVNVSLGYTYGFDNPEENYVPENMDGITTLVSRVAQEAAAKYNMILIIAAGNEGDTPWKIISAPADARSAIAVGATDESLRKKPFSSEGPDFLPYLKPNISCLNDTGGTSFSAPVISGVVACMLQRKPDLTSSQIIHIIERSGHLYPYGNNYEGYGVPNAERILKLLEDSLYDFHTSQQVKAHSNEVLLVPKQGDKACMVFHKKDSWVVLEQQQVKPAGKQLVIRRPDFILRSKMVVDDKAKSAFHTETTKEKIDRTTVVNGEEITEIIWP